MTQHEVRGTSESGVRTPPGGAAGVPRRPLPGPGTAAVRFEGAVHAADIVFGNKIVNQAGPRLVSPVRQLPAAPRDFVGRDGELAALDAARAAAGESDSATVVQIHGMAGVGKTSTVLFWAHQNAGHFGGGQFFLGLRGLSRDAATPAEALFRLLGDLGLAAADIPADEARRGALFRSLVADRRVLVVLDDAADAEQVGKLVPGGRGCLVVVTGRTLLEGLVRDFGAISIPVDPLTIADSWKLAARMLGDGRGEREPEAVAALAASCARLPLAIRIATVGLAVRRFDSVTSLVEELNAGRLDALTLGGAAVPAVRHAFDLSYDSLTPREQNGFRMLGLLHGSDFGAESLGALLAVPVARARELLYGLVRRHLVEPGTAGRFRLHELLSEYAAERLAREDGAEADAAARRLLEWYLTRAREAAAAIAPADAGPASGAAAVSPRRAESSLAWFEAERAAVVAVARQAAGRGEPALAWQFADALFRLLRRDKHGADNLEVHRLGLAAARAAGDRRWEARMLDQLAVVHCDRGNHAEAAAEARAAQEIFTELGDHRLAGWALNTRSRVERQCCRYQDALRHGEHALRILTLAGDRHGAGQGHEQIAQVHWRLGNYRTALWHARESLRVHRELAGGAGEAAALEMISRILRRLGRTDRALYYAGRALAVRERLGDRRGQGEVLDSMSRTLRRSGRLREALRRAQESVRIREDIGDLAGMAMSLISLARVLQTLGDRGGAMDGARRALRVARAADDLYREDEALFTIAAFHHNAGRYPEALGLVTRALALRREIGDRHGEGESLNTLARLMRRRGDIGKALDYGRQALVIRYEITDRRGTADTLDHIARAHHAAGDHREARRHARTALEIQAEIGDRWGRGLSLLLLGTVHLGLDRPEEAREYLARAAIVCGKTGNRPAAEEARGHLRSLPC